MPPNACDVLVVGGGAGGVAAAVSAARASARVLLAERYGFLGGAATQSLVLSYCGFHVNREPFGRAVGGVGWELLQGLQALGWSVAPIRSKSGNQIVMIDAEAVKLVLDRLVLAAGIDLRLHSLVVGVQREGAHITRVTLADHDGLHEVAVKAVVDASGEADVCALAQVPMAQPGGAGAHLQIASMPVRVSGIPVNAELDRVLMASLIETHNRDARHPIARKDGGVFMRLPGSTDRWWMCIDLATPGTSGADLARAETLAREQAHSFIQVLRRHPGFEQARVAATGPQLGIRETRRPQTRRDVCAEDVLGGLRRADAIARASWPMEIHEGPGRQRFVAVGGDEGFYDIGHDALCPLGVDNLRVAGRVVGADAQAFGSTRVMGTAFATGQAAGVSAALWARAGNSEVRAVQAQLRAQGALI